MTQSRGHFVWHELLTPNKESATAFYPRVVSWKTQAWDKAPSYTLWTGPSGALGGLGTPGGGESGDAPMGWLPFVGVSDVSESVDHARRLGARVVTEPSQTPAGGEWAVLADPQGAVFAVYASAGAEDDAAPGEPATGDFSWHELGTTNYKEALKFYSELFDWSLDQVHDMGAMGDYALFAAGNRQLGGMYDLNPKGGQAVSPSWMSYVMVDDADAAAEAATAAGGTILMGPVEVPGGGRIAMILDPDGMRFAVHAAPRKAQRASARPAKKKSKPAPVKAAPAKVSSAKKAAPAKKTGSAKKTAAPKSAAKKTAPAKRSAAKPAAKKAAGKSAKKTTRRVNRTKSARSAAKRAPARSSVRRAPARRKAAVKRKVAPKRAVAKPAAKRGAVRRSVARKAAGGRPLSRAKSGTRGRRGRR